MRTDAFLSRALSTLGAAEGRVFTGAALHVRRDGEIVCDATFGTHTPGGTRVGPDSLFDLASLTKVFSATALLAQFDARRFALDDPVVSVVPEFAGPDPRRLKVSFRHLLAHTSGLPAHVSFRDAAGAGAVLSRVCATPLINAPGTTLTYSDLGFILLGAALERIAELPLDAAIGRSVTEPLGTPNVLFRPDAHLRGLAVCTERDSWRGRLLQGEVHDENCWAMGGVSAHAGLFGTADGVAELAEAHRLGGASGSVRLLTRHTADLAIREAATGADERRSLAWFLRCGDRQSCGSHFGERSFGHTGYTGTSVWVDPDRALTVVLLTNRVYFTRDPAPILELRRAVHDAVIEDIERPAP